MGTKRVYGLIEPSRTGISILIDATHGRPIEMDETRSVGTYEMKSLAAERGTGAPLMARRIWQLNNGIVSISIVNKRWVTA